MGVQFQPTQVIYITDGIQTTFSFLFKILQPDWLEVSLYDPVTKINNIVPFANYTVAIDPDEGGSITIITTPPSAGLNLVIRLNPDFTQEIEIDGPISLLQIEKSLDKLTMFCLQVKNELTRTVKFPYWLGQPPSLEPLVLEQGIDGRMLMWQAGKLINSTIDFDDYYTKVQLDALLALNLVNANAYTDAGLALKANLIHTHVLADLLASGATLGQVITFDGTQWVAQNPTTGVTDHGLLTGLTDDDHLQYHNDARGDVRYNTKAEITTFLAGKANTVHTHPLTALTQSGATNGQVPVWNNVSGQWEAQTPASGVTDHGLLTGLADDDHTQYHNDARGDARYYTQTQLNTGQLDTRYYTESEVNTLLSTNATNDRARANHTGTQLASTISDFAASVLATLLTGVSFATNAAILATDSVLIAFGKIQAQINGHFGVGGSTHPNATTSVSGFMSGADKTKLDGVATGANNYVHPNHTGDVTSTGDGAQVITPDAVTNTKLANMPANTLKGNNTGGSADPLDLTGTQATALLDVFNGTTKGLVPPSGGGTTTFLRADGTFATVPGAGGGAVPLPEDLAPANPVNNTTINLHSRTRTLAPDLAPEYINNYGRTHQLATSLFKKKLLKFDPVIAGTTFQTIGGNTLTATGTATANALAITSFFTSLPRVEAAVTTAAVGVVAGWRTAQAWLRRGGGSIFKPYSSGFRIRMIVGIGRGAVTTDAARRFFAGLTSGNAAPTNVEPSSIANIVGFGYDTADTNIQLMHRDAGAITKIDTGIAKAIGTDNQGVYEIEIFARTNNLGAQPIICGIKDITNGFKKSFDFIQEISTNLPNEDTFLGVRAWATSAAVSSVLGVTLFDITIDQEYLDQ
jgi:hypothetical protein